MYAFSKSLGDAAKAARSSLKYTQAQVADLIDAEVRTVMHIENYKANPQMTILYPLVRVLEAVFTTGGCWMGEGFCPQSRQIFEGVLSHGEKI